VPGNTRGARSTLEVRHASRSGYRYGDPRFQDDPVTAEELPELAITISVLHPDRELSNPLDFECGVDGVVSWARDPTLGTEGLSASSSHGIRLG